uniref:SEA domain-containing protein n=1 Tax=Capra hircus TaxID=9925 RepID=A0A8C2Y2H8_CAPHI
MTPDIQAPFSLLLLFQVLTVANVTVLTASVPTSPSSTVQVSSTQSSPTSSPTKETSIPKPATIRSREAFWMWPGSVVVDLTLAFREGTTAELVKAQFSQLKAHAANYSLTISGVSVRDAQFPSSAPSASGVPGWGIALLVLVCVLVALAIIYLIALVVCQCGRKKCEQLDIFPTLDAYHPMSEYSAYHTHGRFVPPGSTKRSPYEEVSAGNGGSNLSYTNLAATSANL